MKEDSINNMQLNSANMFFTAVFQEWLLNPDKSFISCFKKVYRNSEILNVYLIKENGETIKNNNVVERQLLQQQSYAMLDSIISQMFCYFYENIRKNYNASMDIDKSKFNKLRSDIIQGKSLNNDQIIDVIRQSIAHNNDLEQPNFQISLDDHSFCFGLNNDTQLKLGHNQLIDVLNLYIKNSYKVDLENNILLIDNYEIKNLKSKMPNYQKVRFFSKQNNKEFLPDEHQKVAIDSLVEIIRQRSMPNFDLLYRLYPSKQHAASNHICMQDFYLIFRDLYKCRMMTVGEYFYRQKELSSTGFCYLDKHGDILALFYMNRLFNVFSTTSNSDLQSILEKIKPGLKINNLRNAVIHGTFFYDRAGGFAFYDGKSEKGKLKQEKDLSLVAYLSFEDVHNFCNEQFLYKNNKSNDGRFEFKVENTVCCYDKTLE